MNFFKTLAGTGINDIVIQMKQDGQGQITVFVTPKSIAQDSALKTLKPIYVTGTPEEIDAEFFAIISAPLEETQKVFTNIESFEAQKAEALKATEDKKKEKEAKKKTAEKTTTDDESEEEDSEATEKPAKEVKINHEKVLKDFMVSIKNDNILDHKERLLQLFANLSVAESEKAPIKKIRAELQTAIKKQESIDAARAKMRITPKTEEAIASVTETPVEVKEVVNSAPEISVSVEIVAEEEEEEAPLTTKASFANRNNVPEAIQEIAAASPNVIIASVPGPEKAPTIVEETEVVAETVAPAPMAPPVPVAPPTPVYEDVTILEMIDKTFSYEQYIAASWTDDLLIQNGKAKWTTIKREVVPTAPPVPVSKVSYSFPKPFEEPEEENEDDQE